MLTVVHSEQWLGKLTLLARSSSAVDKLAESVFKFSISSYQREDPAS